MQARCAGMWLLDTKYTAGCRSCSNPMDSWMETANYHLPTSSLQRILGGHCYFRVDFEHSTLCVL